jgi:hypothetical protein
MRRASEVAGSKNRLTRRNNPHPVSTAADQTSKVDVAWPGLTAVATTPDQPEVAPPARPAMSALPPLPPEPPTGPKTRRRPSKPRRGLVRTIIEGLLEYLNSRDRIWASVHRTKGVGWRGALILSCGAYGLGEGGVLGALLRHIV